MTIHTDPASRVVPGRVTIPIVSPLRTALFGPFTLATLLGFLAMACPDGDEDGPPGNDVGLDTVQPDQELDGVEDPVSDVEPDNAMDVPLDPVPDPDQEISPDDGGDDGERDDQPETEVDQADTEAGVVTDCGFDPGVTYEPFGMIWQLVSQDEQTCVRLIREDACPPETICMANPYHILLFTIGHQGTVVTIEDSGRLLYTPSWHNWDDSAQGFTDTSRYLLEIDYDGTTGFYYRFTVTAFDFPGGDMQWGPIEVAPTD